MRWLKILTVGAALGLLVGCNPWISGDRNDVWGVTSCSHSAWIEWDFGELEPGKSLATTWAGGDGQVLLTPFIFYRRERFYDGPADNLLVAIGSQIIGLELLYRDPEKLKGEC
jgi:hypothetical protein